ncbi:MAG: histidinol dehydrogenase [Syntrophales bacterium]
MRVIRTGSEAFDLEFRRIRHRGDLVEEFENVVRPILKDVAARGDEAVFEYTRKYDASILDSRTVEVTPQEMEQAVSSLASRDLEILELAAARIEHYHRKQLMESRVDADEDGIELGYIIRPLERVGIYAPGGLAVYPSTVLMAAIPARIAGVSEIILVTPAKGGRMNPFILAAARLAGVHRVFKVGGAQAIAALAYGTASIPPVDKIVGPGNAYVTAAKKIVFGTVGIDMTAGPSEVLIISDGTADPVVAAADLLSQAEHDCMACSILLTPHQKFANKVASEVESQIKKLSKGSIVERAIADFGAVIITRDMDEAIEVANRFAPEHLQLMVANPGEMLGRIRNAGAVFLGYTTPEVIGDYLAGPSHILPTGGAARFASPLGVYDFLKRTSVISFSREALGRYAEAARRFAEMEKLDAHGNSITVRLNPKKS